jgi:glycosyltransferase involved in cell wall biosynthesis
VLLHVGRLAPEKNVEVALDAYERLRAAVPSLRMVVVGDGPSRGRLQARYPQVRFAGTQRGTDLARHYASADVFLFPSLTDTFGNVTLEAMASGLAVVAYDTAAAGMHVQDGINGWLAQPQGGVAGAEAYFQATRRALAAAQVNSPLRRQARQTARAADWDSVLRAFEQRLRATAGVAPAPRTHAALA